MVSKTFYRNHLEPNLTGLYDTLENALSHRNSSPNVGNVSSDNFYKVFSGVCMDHPEYSYCSGIYATVANGVANLAFLNSDDNKFAEKVNAAVTQIYAMLRGRTDDYSKVKAIFDYLASTLTYDYDIYDEYYKVANDPDQSKFEQFAINNAFGFSAYAVFTVKKAVCEGIAKAFKILCDLFEVPCMCTLCYERNGEEKGAPHMNNLVTVDGVDSYVDVTFCLPQKQMPLVRYDFFLASREEMEKCVIFDTDYPGEVGPHNFFTKRGLRFNSQYKLRAFLASYDATINNREIRFRYSGGELKEEEVRDFCTKILNKYAPAGKQWVTYYDYGCFNGVLCDSGQIKKMRES